MCDAMKFYIFQVLRPYENVKPFYVTRVMVI